MLASLAVQITDIAPLVLRVGLASVYCKTDIALVEQLNYLTYKPKNLNLIKHFILQSNKNK